MLTKKSQKLISTKSAGAHAAKFQTYKADKMFRSFKSILGYSKKKTKFISITLNLINLHFFLDYKF